MNLRPLSDRVLVRKDNLEQKTAGGIILPDIGKKSRVRCFTGMVIAVGEGRKYPNGETHPVEVEVGDTVIFNKFTGTELGKTYDVADDELIVLCEADIYARIPCSTEKLSS